jgi:prepilin-type N-terminal cleavage/methylation domain-containing protein
MNCTTHSTHFGRFRETRGYTLIELMTVVTVLSVTTMMAVPNFLTMTSRTSLQRATKDLHSNLNLARMTAMNRNTTVTVGMAVANGHVTATFTDRTGTVVMPAQVMPSELTGHGGVATVGFTSLGLRAGGGTSNQTMTLTNRQGVTYEIQVTPAGRARWCATSPCT